MRLPISLMSLLVGASVPALAAVTLSGKVIDQSGAGKAGVTVSFQGATAITSADGTWLIPVVNTGISSRLSNGRQVTTGGGHLILDEGHLRVSLSGYDLMGRPRSGSSVSILPSGIASGISARVATSGIDTIQYLWNTKTFLRDTASASRSGIVAIFDTTVNASIIYGWLTDVRDRQVYRTVKIGTQTWMAQNLNYKRSGSDSGWCPNADGSSVSGPADSCSKYGRLYTWSGAMDASSALNATLPHQGICPSGWHVPSDAEWTKLTDTTLSSSTSGAVLKSTSGCCGWSGTDAYGFSVLWAGYHSLTSYFGPLFGGLGYGAYFWSSSEYDASDAWDRTFRRYDAGVSRDYFRINEWDYFSLRCLQN